MLKRIFRVAAIHERLTTARGVYLFAKEKGDDKDGKPQKGGKK